jgi:hypothetical protein
MQRKKPSIWLLVLVVFASAILLDRDLDAQDRAVFSPPVTKLVAVEPGVRLEVPHHVWCGWQIPITMYFVRMSRK